MSTEKSFASCSQHPVGQCGAEQSFSAHWAVLTEKSNNHLKMAAHVLTTLRAARSVAFERVHLGKEEAKVLTHQLQPFD